MCDTTVSACPSICKRAIWEILEDRVKEGDKVYVRHSKSNSSTDSVFTEGELHEIHLKNGFIVVKNAAGHTHISICEIIYIQLLCPCRKVKKGKEGDCKKGYDNVFLN